MPELKEENLSLNLEICDYVNEKPHRVQMEADILLKYIHSRNERVSQLALGVLDSCVKNCGFPFHLHIASKQFLNELVSTFPDKPPVRRWDGCWDARGVNGFVYSMTHFKVCFLFSACCVTMLMFCYHGINMP